jgi:regulator of sigma E protease
MKGESDDDTTKGSFGAASVTVKSKVMVAGVVMNLIVALALFTLLALIGTPKLIDNQFSIKSDTHVVSNTTLINYLEPGSPAAKAGLKTEDELKSIGLPGKTPIETPSATALPGIVKKFGGQAVIIQYSRAGHMYKTKTTLLTSAVVNASQKTNNPKAYLGVGITEYTVQRSTWSAPIVAVGFSAQVTALTFEGLGHALGGLGSIIAGTTTHNTAARQNGQTSASASVSGPVGIVYILKDGSLLGYQFILFFIAIISLTLAIMNILPIPALDGGQLWITLIAKALKRPISAKRLATINAAGFAVLIVLIVLITIVDLKRY